MLVGAIALAAVGVTIGVVAMLRAQPSSTPHPDEAPQATAVDAGESAGAGTHPMVAATQPDASTQIAAVDPVPAPDAGRPAPVRVKLPAKRDPSGPMTATEEQYLKELAQLAAENKWNDIAGRRSTMLATLHTEAAMFRGYLLQVQAACWRKDLRVLHDFLSNLHALASPATLAKAKRDCVTVWPGAESAWDG
jgi:type IV secretory pathway VirB10-like protein